MEVINPREEEINRQLLPGSSSRDVNLVNSVAELRKQMEDSNSAIIRSRRRIMLASSILALGTLFFAFKSDGGTKLAKYLKLIGSAFALLSVVKGTSSQEGRIKLVPSSKDFSHSDRVYSLLRKVQDIHENSLFAKAVVRFILDFMIAYKLIEPYELKSKQAELRNNRNSDIEPHIIKAIIQY